MASESAPPRRDEGTGDSEVEPRRRDLQILLSASEELTRSLALPEVLERLARQLLRVLPAWRVGILLAEGDERTLRLAAGASVGTEDLALPIGRLLEIGRYPEVREAMETRSAVLIDDVATHSLMSGVRDPVEQAGLRSLLVVPLVTENRALGVLSLAQRAGDPRFSDRELALVSAVANQAAVAIRNAQLYGELAAGARQLEAKVEERTRRLRESSLRLAVVNDITTAINMALDRTALLEAAMSTLRRLDAFERVQVHLAAPAPSGRFLAHGLDDADHLVTTEVALEGGATQLLKLDGTAVDIPGEAIPAAPESHLLAPVVSKEGVVGVVQVFSSRPGAFVDADLELLQQVAGEVAIALERSALFDAAQHRSRQLEVISDIGRELTGAVAFEDFLPTAARLIQRALGYWLVAVLTLDESGEQLEVAGSASADTSLDAALRAHRQASHEGACGRAFTTGQAVLASDVTRAPVFLAQDGLPTRAELAVPIRVSGRTLGILDVQSDVTGGLTSEDLSVGRMLADQLAAALNLSRLFADLQEEREFSARIINNLTGGLIVTDRRRVVQVVNTRGAEMLRAEPSELMGRDLLETLPTAAPLIHYSPDSISRECEIELPDGTSVPIGFSNAFFVDAAADRAAIIITFRDLSEVRELQRKVRQAERLATIGTVAAGVAHEIRNPLFGISATAQVLAGELPAGSPLAELCQSMLDETRRLDRLVTSLVKYGRSPELVLTPVDPCEVWDEAIEACRAQAEQSDVKVVHRCRPRGRMLAADHDQLKQVFLNLLLNALEAAPGERVDVSVEWDHAGQHATSTITDRGPGLGEDEVDKVFDLFYTTKAKGSGMGLAISRKIVEDHGGTLIARQAPGGGARFDVVLPVREPLLSTPP